MLLNVVRIKKSFADDEILSDVSLRVDRREKVILVGRNGTGKTTLLRLITGQDEPDGGSIHLARGAKVGYLRQEFQVEGSRTVREEAEQARKEQLALRARLDELETRLENNPTDDELEEYATLHEHYLEAEGYSAERDMRTVLQRMGFEENELDKPASELSGGEKTRLALARLLLEQPDLLILDEPTNHLDLQATEWLEGWLRSYPGAVLLISHDRAFLEGMGDKVVELRDGVTKAYPGPFEKYLKLKSEDEARQAEVARRQGHQMAKLDEYVRRFMNSQRTAQARGRLKMLEKLQSSAVGTPKKDRSMAAGFKTQSRSGDIVLASESLSFAYPGAPTLLQNIDLTIRQGERWGVIGENGAGKSTLIKLLLGKLQPDSGSARRGSNVELAYFAQDVVDLDPKQSPLDYLVWDFDLQPGEARNLLGRFLFEGDDVFRPIKTLSGGEKNKLVLASLSILNPNLLVLDEPTNHLDMDSREALAQVIKDYKGTLVLISHDRWLLDQVTDHTLDVRRNGVRQFAGSYREYVARQSKSATQAAPQKIELPESKLSPREVSKELERRERELHGVESAIGKLEANIKALEAKLASIQAGDDVVALSKEHASMQLELNDALADWELLEQTLDGLRALQA